MNHEKVIEVMKKLIAAETRVENPTDEI